MSRREEYLAELRATLPGVVTALTAKGVAAHHLAFGGEGSAPAKRAIVPTDARSEFLANRAMGDWAERQVAEALTRAFPEWKTVPYGNAERFAAGEAGFKDFYLAGLEETRRFGKRPDLLLFSIDASVADDLSDRSREESDPVVLHAMAAMEVRSSKFDALHYMEVRRRQRAEGRKDGRETPSFTVKVEDLVIVFRWLERYGVPQTYCQVFFDSIFAVNFLEIFRIIAGGVGFTIESPAKSQEKATIMIPITRGVQTGTAVSVPDFAAEHRITALGRHDAYVVPKGGRFELDPAAFRSVLLST